MWTIIGILGFLLAVVSIIAIPVTLFRKTGTTKRWVAVLLLSFVLFVAGALNTPTSSDRDTNPTDTVAGKAQSIEESQSQTLTGNTDGSSENNSVEGKEKTANEARNKNQPAGESAGAAGNTDQQLSGLLKVHFLDVGQADAILLQLPNKRSMLIDAGNNEDAGFVVNYIKNAGVKKIDYLVGTHPHEDHIGGLDAVINSFDIGRIIMPAITHTTQTFRDVLEAIKNKGLKAVKVESGKVMLDENGLTVKLLAPVRDSYDDLNNYSAVVMVTFGETSFLFMGDAEDRSEADILQNEADVKANVLKVGHHGSSSSTTEALLKAVSPEYAVISVGKDNDYGHPSPYTLAKLNDAGVKVFRTDLQGTITATSDGKTIMFNKKAVPMKERAPDSSTETLTESSGSASSGVKIVSISLSNEVVTIKNTKNKDVDMSGWSLVSLRGNQMYYFPKGYVLKAGATVRVWSGRNAEDNPPSDLKWTGKYIWNNDGDAGVLKDAEGNIVSRYGG